MGRTVYSIGQHKKIYLETEIRCHFPGIGQNMTIVCNLVDHML